MSIGTGELEIAAARAQAEREAPEDKAKQALELAQARSLEEGFEAPAETDEEPEKAAEPVLARNPGELIAELTQAKLKLEGELKTALQDAQDCAGEVDRYYQEFGPLRGGEG